MRDIRIVAGLGGQAGDEAVAALAGAGVDELFVGYVPEAWAERYGFEASPNRRYRSRIQIGAREQLARVVQAASTLGLLTHVALNEHLIAPEQLPLADEIAATALEVGAHGLILGSLPLAARYHRRHPDAHLVASGEAPVYNRAALELAARLGFSRIILPRETNLADLEALATPAADLGLELEAFLLGEWCAFNGALCLTCHGYGTARDFCSSHTARVVLDTASRTAAFERPVETEEARRADREAISPVMRPNTGGCNLCALARLRELGVRYVKVPGRSTEALETVRRVRALLDRGDLSPAACRAALDDPAYCNGSNCWLRPAGSL